MVNARDDFNLQHASPGGRERQMQLPARPYSSLR